VPGLDGPSASDDVPSTAACPRVASGAREGVDLSDFNVADTVGTDTARSAGRH
jgi:hypothetical protein